MSNMSIIPPKMFENAENLLKNLICFKSKLMLDFDEFRNEMTPVFCYKLLSNFESCKNVYYELMILYINSNFKLLTEEDIIKSFYYFQTFILFGIGEISKLFENPFFLYCCQNIDFLTLIQYKLSALENEGIYFQEAWDILSIFSNGILRLDYFENIPKNSIFHQIKISYFINKCRKK